MTSKIIFVALTDNDVAPGKVRFFSIPDILEFRELKNGDEGTSIRLRTLPTERFVVKESIFTVARMIKEALYNADN